MEPDALASAVVECLHFNEPEKSGGRVLSPVTNQSSQYLALDDSQGLWLNRFLNGEGTNPGGTCVAIVDSANANLSYRIFVLGKQVACSDQNLCSSACHDITQHTVNTRIVILLHDGCREVDRNAISILYETYHLDPLFVFTHFYRDHKSRKAKDTQYPQLGLPDVEPVSLPSLVNFLLLDFGGEQLSAFIADGSPRTGTHVPKERN